MGVTGAKGHFRSFALPLSGRFIAITCSHIKSQDASHALLSYQFLLSFPFIHHYNLRLIPVAVDMTTGLELNQKCDVLPLSTDLDLCDAKTRLQRNPLLVKVAAEVKFIGVSGGFRLAKRVYLEDVG